MLASTKLGLNRKQNKNEVKIQQVLRLDYETLLEIWVSSLVVTVVGKMLPLPQRVVKILRLNT